MLQAYRTYIQLCFFRGSVAKANASTAALAIVCVLFAGTSVLHFQFAPYLNDPINFYGRTLVVFSAFNVLMFLALVYRQNQSRYRKVLSTFVGTRIVIDVCMIIIIVVFPTEEDLRLVLTTVIALWRMCIVGYILKEALNVPLPAGILISIVFTFVSLTLADLTMGFPSTPEAIPSSE